MMLKLLTFVLITSCAEMPVDQVLEHIKKQQKVSKQEVGMGLKEALKKGVGKSVSSLSQTDAFYKNPSLKIPFPSEAEQVKQTLNKIGLSSLTDKVVQSLNQAAEKATDEARPIFLGAISKLTFKDVMKILNGSKTEASDFLQRTTSNDLTKAFQPKIKESLDEVEATKYWNQVMSKYNSIPFVEKVDLNLSSYVTDLAIKGLFEEIKKEEVNIRENPVARTSELLKRVFTK